MLIDNFSQFFADVAACPISKDPLRIVDDHLVAPCGFVYENGDLRVGLNFAKEWKKGQNDFLAWRRRWLERFEKNRDEYTALDAEVRDVYAEIKMSGNVLDVGCGVRLGSQAAGIRPG